MTRTLIVILPKRFYKNGSARDPCVQGTYLKNFNKCPNPVRCFMEDQLAILKTHIEENYEPASSFQEANLRLTSAQIIEKISEHFLGSIDADEIITLFTELGFKYTSVELTFYWLINTK